MLLGDSDFLTECKWGNAKLINLYLPQIFKLHSFDREKVGQLLNYVISMPPENASHDQGHK